MSTGFLESTALIDLCFKDRQTKRSVRALATTYSPKISSRYVVYEICRGYLRYLILLYNKSLQCERYADLIAYARNTHLRRHLQGSILEAFERFFREASFFDPHSHLSQDVQLLRSFRGFLRRVIRQGWARLSSSVDSIINDVGCREDIEAPKCDEAGYDQELKSVLCGRVSNCGLKPYIERHKGSFELVREELRKIDAPDMETQKRIKSLRELYRVPKRDFDGADCWRCGDAIILHETPKGSVTITSNERHFAPLATIIGRSLHVYSCPRATTS